MHSLSQQKPKLPKWQNDEFVNENKIKIKVIKTEIKLNLKSKKTIGN